MLDWFDYHGHMCIAFEMLGLSVFDFLVSFFFLYCNKKFIHSVLSRQSFLYALFGYAERQQLPALFAGPGPAHWIPVVLRRPILARQQAHAHRPQTGEYPLCRLGL